MMPFLTAHGYDPGPTQRPGLAGAICGLAATLPATALLYGFGSLHAESAILRLGVLETVAEGAAAMTISGVLYGRLFQRAANDRRGGWLFGMAFGFVLWMAGAVMVLPILSDGLTPAGAAAVGVFLSLLAWGTALGILFPYVHRPLHVDINERSVLKTFGPNSVIRRHKS